MILKNLKIKFDCFIIINDKPRFSKKQKGRAAINKHISKYKNGAVEKSNVPYSNRYTIIKSCHIISQTNIIQS